MSNHEWSRDGERCIKCGDKDWMAGPECNGTQENRTLEQIAADPKVGDVVVVKPINATYRVVDVFGGVVYYLIGDYYGRRQLDHWAKFCRSAKLPGDDNG